MDFSRLKPIVVILGATGTGKSKLGIEIASKFNGEIISADSMQIYKGLPITTNKVTEEEQTEVKHHMLDFLDPHKKFTVVDYRDQTLAIIDKLHIENKLPLLVGGTHYYVESILWDLLVAVEINKISEENSKVMEDKRADLEGLSNKELLEKLFEVDPDIAEIYHPNNRRKIIRSLEVYYQTGKQHSEHYRQQRESAKQTDLGGTLRYPNAIVLWITCDKDILDKRLDGRVDAMLEHGLLEELTEFDSNVATSFLKETSIGESNKDKLREFYTHGLFQNIGVKEFHPYISLNDEDKKTKEGVTIYEEALENMKIRTRQYSRKQTQWMNNRFLGRPRQYVPVYELNGSNLEKWSENIKVPASTIVDHFLKSEDCPISPIRPNIAQNSLGNKTRHTCEVCDKVIIGDVQWDRHIKGAKHRKVLKRKNKSSSEEQNKFLKVEEESA